MDVFWVRIDQREIVDARAVFVCYGYRLSNNRFHKQTTGKANEYNKLRDARAPFICYTYRMKKYPFIQCVHCKIRFEANRSDARFCSAACRMAVSRMARSASKAKADREKDRSRHTYKYAMDTMDRRKLSLLTFLRDNGTKLKPEVLQAIEDTNRKYNR